MAGVELAPARHPIAGSARTAMSELAIPLRTANFVTEADKARSLLRWLTDHLGEAFKVEIPSLTAPCFDGFRRFYVRKGGRRAVVRVKADFLTERDDREFSTCLLSASPTVLDLIRAGALHIDVDGLGSASAPCPPCR